MKAIEVNAGLLRAAMFMQAKNDVRFYLNGVLLHSSGYVVSTNGHCMYKADDEGLKQLESNVIIAIAGTIPTKAEVARIHFLDEKEGYITFLDSIGHPLQSRGRPSAAHRRFFDVVEGKYPDIDRVIPASELQPTESIGVNAEYLGLVGKCAKAMGIRYPAITMNLRGADSVIEAVISGPELTAHAFIMPCKV